MDENILAWLSEHAYLTSTQMAGLGFSRTVMQRLVAAGRVLHPAKGVFLAAGDRTSQETHALLTEAALVDDPFAYATHASALALLGAPFFRVPILPVHIADARRSSRVHGRVHRHVLRDGDVVRRTARMVEPALAAVLVAATHGPSSGIVAMDWLLHSGLCSSEDLERIIESGRVRRGLVGARFAVEHADGRAQSPGESLLRGVLVGARFHFDAQVLVPGRGTPYEVDFMVEGRVVVEFDGDVKYGGNVGQAELVREKRREDWLRGQGYEVVRVVWSDLEQPMELGRRIREAALRARARQAAA